MGKKNNPSAFHPESMGYDELGDVLNDDDDKDSEGDPEYFSDLDGAIDDEGNLITDKDGNLITDEDSDPAPDAYGDIDRFTDDDGNLIADHPDNLPDDQGDEEGASDGRGE